MEGFIRGKDNRLYDLCQLHVVEYIKKERNKGRSRLIINFTTGDFLDFFDEEADKLYEKILSMVINP